MNILLTLTGIVILVPTETLYLTIVGTFSRPLLRPKILGMDYLYHLK